MHHVHHVPSSGGDGQASGIGKRHGIRPIGRGPSRSRAVHLLAIHPEHGALATPHERRDSSTPVHARYTIVSGGAD